MSFPDYPIALALMLSIYIKMICDMSWYKLQSPYLHPTPSKHKNTEGERSARIRTIKFKEKLKQ